MIIGQATLGLEIIEELMGIDVVILPTVMDDCGLTAGIAMAIKEVNPNIMTIVSKQVFFIIESYCI